jgi:predicted glycosyltransferase
MKILLDIGHPAHVHYFKNVLNKLQADGIIVKVIARDKEMTHTLLKEYGIEFINRGKGKNTFVGKLSYLIKANFQLLRVSLNFKPDIFIGFGSPYAAQISYLLSKPSVILDDTENAKLGQLFYKNFAKTILTPDCFKPSFGKKHLKFSGYMELSYLHPNVFKFDEQILENYGISSNENYSVLRFVSWNAHHDFGHKGLSIQNKVKAVKAFSKFGKVLITSEKELPAELEPYRMKINPIHIHHILGGASLFYGESATMASESAVLGTPAVYLDDVGRGYTKEQESKYGLVFNFSESQKDQELSIIKGQEILQMGKVKFEDSKFKLINDKIDTSAFLFWFIKYYPQSQQIMQATPDCQFNFE